MKEVLTLFHHIHHENGNHKVHHCGNEHEDVDCTIEHCKCGLHRIDKQKAIGHDFKRNEVEVEFAEKCPEGGWHVESGGIGN